MLAACKDRTRQPPGRHGFGNGCVRQVVPRTERYKEADEGEDDATEAHVGGGGGCTGRTPDSPNLSTRVCAEQNAQGHADPLPGGVDTGINSFADRPWPTKPAGAPRAVVPNVKACVGDMLHTARDYLGGVTLK